MSFVNTAHGKPQRGRSHAIHMNNHWSKGNLPRFNLHRIYRTLRDLLLFSVASSNLRNNDSRTLLRLCIQARQ